MNDACACCHRRDGLSSGGCLYCTARTFCACGRLIACGCGQKIDAHACPSVTIVGTIEPIPTLPLAEIASSHPLGWN